MLKPTFVVVALLLLAGCADPPATEEDAFEDLDFGDVEATDTTGVIRGVVIDEAIRPVVGVLVNLTGTLQSKTTGDDGTFSFSGLEPGTYFLQASKLGFAGLQTSAEVVAGVNEPAIVKMQLTADPSTAPRAVLYHLDGYIGCSVRPMIMGLQCGGFSASDVVNADYELEAIPDWVQSEMVWTSTQAVGDELSLAIRCLGSERCPDGQLTIARAEGRAPLVATINRTAAEFWALGAPDGDPLSISIFAFGRSDLDVYNEETVDGAQKPVTGEECLLWPAGPLAGNCMRMTGPGFVLNQKVDVYTHVFYGFLPDDGWTFVNDGAPTPPQP